MDSILTEKFKEVISGDDADQIINIYLLHLNNLRGNMLMVNLEDVWKLVGFTHKHKVKSFVLRKRFVRDTDYSVTPRFPQRIGPHIDDVIMMTLDTFQAVCVISDTQQGSDVFHKFCSIQSAFFRYSFALAGITPEPLSFLSAVASS